MVIFIELVQYAKNLGGKSQENLVEHQIIKKMIRKFNSIICRFFEPHSQYSEFSRLHVWGAKITTNDAIKFSYHHLLSDAQPDFSGTFHQDFSHIAQAR